MTQTFVYGLNHLKAYRIFETVFTPILKKYELSMSEWLLLGQVFLHTNGIQASTLALLLDVEPPFITRIINSLEKKKLLKRKKDFLEKRVKHILLTKKGYLLIGKVEKELQKKVKCIFAGINLPSLLIYRRVLKQLGRKNIAL